MQRNMLMDKLLQCLSDNKKKLYLPFLSDGDLQKKEK